MTPPPDEHAPSPGPSDPDRPDQPLGAPDGTASVLDETASAPDRTASVLDETASLLDQVDFKRLGLRNQLLRRLDETGYDRPTPIQREAIPAMLAGRDVLGQAATGTGKTAAFSLPILHAIGRTRADTPRALVIAPTRELALQVTAAVAGYGKHLGIRALAVVGGQPAHRQVKALARGVHVVVATPGRAVDLLGRGVLDLSAVDTVVLDEADEMLDMGFAEDLDAILAAAPSQRQTVLFSATVPARIDHLARQHLHDPVRIVIARPTTESGAPLVDQRVAYVRRSDKAAALGRFLDMEAPEAAIVFCRTRVEVDALTVTMNGRGHRAEALHGGMDQRQRDAVMRRLRDGTATLLLATDVAARGLDVDTLTHVFNHDVPSQAEAYVHRIGRVGRAGRRGVAITLAEPKQRRNIGFIERLLGRELPVVDVPSVDDLHARQVELTAADLAEVLDDDPTDAAQQVLDALLEEGHEPHDIVLAALGLLHGARGSAADDAEIPDARAAARADTRGRKQAKEGRGGTSGAGDHRHLPDGAWVHVSLGRVEGVRPADLVGAIANEGGLSGSDIGPIKIAQHHSRVGIPAASVDHVVSVMAHTTVRGQKATVRRWVE